MAAASAVMVMAVATASQPVARVSPRPSERDPETGSGFVGVCQAPCKGEFLRGLKSSPVLSLLIPLQEASRRQSIRSPPL